MNSLRRSVALAVLFALAASSLVRAQAVVAGAPATIDYQGKALDSAGTPLANTSPTNYEMQFRIYDAQESGSIIWSEKQIVTVSKGLFSVRLGEGTANGAEGSIPQSNLPEAFNGSARFLGVTIVITGQSSAEIQPRLAFLATPFAYVANKSISAERLILSPSTTAAASSINLAQVSYATQSVSSSLTLTDQNHTAIVDTASAAVTVNLPGVTTRREYFVTKKDASLNFVTVKAPDGGSINGTQNGVIKLKVLGESVVIQNTGGNDWWVISDTRDSTPVGTIIVSGQNSATPPRGYVACDGALYSRTAAQFVDLFSALLGSSTAPAWGNTNVTDFRVPDLRGVFLRGVDAGRGYDPDSNNRTASSSGGNAGGAVGSYQDGAISQHDHTFRAQGNTGNAGSHNHASSTGPFTPSGQWGLIRSSDSSSNSTAASSGNKSIGQPEITNYNNLKNIPFDGDHSHTYDIAGTSGLTGAGETRPKNVAVYYFIKY